MFDDDHFLVMVMMPVVSVPMMSDMFFVDFNRRANFHGLRFSHG
jgi:hypothetical protein